MARYVKFMRGTTTAYNKLTEKDDDTLYFLSDSINEEGSLYLGNKLISGPCNVPGGGSTVTNLSDLADVMVTNDIDFDALLVYDKHDKVWVSYSFDALTFAEASGDAPGMAGLVPAPPAGSQNLFLKGDGTWANPCDSTLIYTIETEKGQTHDQAIQEVLPDDVIVNNGDIVIVKDCIFRDTENNIEKLQHTSYIYKDGNWIAMDGNYNAENVYFQNNLVFTENIGTIVVGDNGRAEVATAGQNLKQVFETIFSQEKQPEIELPSITLEAPENIAWEVGSKVSPTYKITFNPGSYSYGPDTGITVVEDSYKIVATDIADEDALKTTEGAFPEIEVTDETSYYITASLTHTQGDLPLTNLNNAANGRIPSNTISTSSAELKGYRSFFYGMDNTNEEITGDYIREHLTNGGIYNSQKKLIFDVSELTDATRFIVAVPADSTRSGLVNAIILTSLNANVTKEYKELDAFVPVEGANNYKAANYKLWVYQPASIAENEVHVVTLS